MKKSKKILFLILNTPFFCAGCGSNVKDKTPESIYVTFENYDNTVIYRTKIPYGTKAIYEGEEPSRDMTAEKVYIFEGWGKDINEPLYDNTVFKASFKEETRKYVVTFYNYDGSVLQRNNTEYGKRVKYDGPLPTRKSNDEHIEYSFSKWDADLDDAVVLCDLSFTAQFNVKEYVFATFKNYDGKQLSREKIEKGTAAKYNGQTPTRSYSGDDKAYKFKGWDKSLQHLTVDTSFTAQFDLLNYYTVTFKNYDNSVLQTCKVLEGDDAKYTGQTPSKPSTKSGDYIYSYGFYGWSESIENITSNLTVTAAYTTKITVTGATAIRQHLEAYGSGNYKNVETAYSSDGTSTLGYSGSYFYIGHIDNSSSLESYMAIMLTYGASSGSGLFQVIDSGVTMFSAKYTIKFADREFDSMSCDSITTNRYKTTNQVTAVAALGLLAAKFAANNANRYLSNHNLPYVF